MKLLRHASQVWRSTNYLRYTIQPASRNAAATKTYPQSSLPNSHRRRLPKGYLQAISLRMPWCHQQEASMVSRWQASHTLSRLSKILKVGFLRKVMSRGRIKAQKTVWMHNKTYLSRRYFSSKQLVKQLSRMVRSHLKLSNYSQIQVNTSQDLVSEIRFSLLLK